MSAGLASLQLALAALAASVPLSLAPAVDSGTLDDAEGKVDPENLGTLDWTRGLGPLRSVLTGAWFEPQICSSGGADATPGTAR